MKLFLSRLHYNKEPGLTEIAILSVLRFFALFYTLITDIRNTLYDKNILPAYNSKAFVVSVGNLTTGGTGKTPVTAEIANYFLGLNKRTAIISRGYGAKLSGKDPVEISDGSGTKYNAEDAGDEPVWLAENCKGAVVVICQSRINAEKYLKETCNPDVIVLDDGFQHRKIKRDLDIVVIDAKNKFGNGYMLPAGPLRERISSISRADKIIVTNKNRDSKNALKYCDFLKKKLKKDIYLCNIVPDYAYNIVTGEHLRDDEKIMAFSAIGQPEEFYNFLKKEYRLAAVLDFEDHHKYEREDISKIIHFAQEENITSLVTTEKDAVKLAGIVKDLELPVKIFALKLKTITDIGEICGK